MKNYLILLLRFTLTVLLIQLIYNTVSGNVIKPYHPYNLILGLFLMLSGLSIWFRPLIAQILAVFSGVIWPVMVFFQMGSLYFVLPTGKWSSDFLWFKLEGNIALLYSFGIPATVLFLSGAVCISLLIEMSEAEKLSQASVDALNHTTKNQQDENYKWLLLVPISFLLMISLISIPSLIRNWDSHKFNPTSGNKGIVKTSLKESNSDYYSISIGHDDENENGVLYFDCVGGSVEKVISSLQQMDIIKAKWVINRHLLPDGFYDIDFGDKIIRKRDDIPNAFYNWVSHHFTINLEEKRIIQKVKFCEVPIDRGSIQISTELEPSSFTESVDGEFGMQFEGISLEEFCDWLTDNTGQLIVCKNDSEIRYDFFLPCFPHPHSKHTIFEGLKKLNFKLSNGSAEIQCIIVNTKS